MSSTADMVNNYQYLTSDPITHVRKGKFNIKTKKDSKRINKFKKKNHINSKTNISTYDVYKNNLSKKIHQKALHQIRNQGREIKLLKITNETPHGDLYGLDLEIQEWLDEQNDGCYGCDIWSDVPFYYYYFYDDIKCSKDLYHDYNRDYDYDNDYDYD